MTKIYLMDEFGRENKKACSEIRKGNKTERWEDIFRSGYSVSKFSFGDPDEMKYKGLYYSFNSRMAVETDVVEDERMKICNLYTLSRYADDAGLDPNDDIEVVMAESAPVDNVGRDTIPNAQYFEQNEDEADMTLYHGQTRYFRISKCYTLPEGKVAFSLCRNEATESGLSDVIVIDIGSRTMNVIVWHYDIHKKMWIVVDSYTVDVGCVLLLNEIKRQLRLENVSVSEDVIETAIYGHKVSTAAADAVYKCVNEATDRYISQNIIGQLVEHRTDITAPYCLVGGTGDMLNSRLKEKLDVRWNLGVMANAIGGYATLKALAKRDRL